MQCKKINQTESCKSYLEQPFKKWEFLLRKIVLLSGKGLCWLTILKSMFCWVVKRKGLEGGIIPEKRTVGWVLSHLNCSLSSTVDWRVGPWADQEQVAFPGVLQFTEGFCPVPVMNCTLFQNTCCPFLQASPSPRKEHTFCSFDVSHSLRLPSWSVKSQYSLHHGVFTSESTTHVPNRGCSVGLLPDHHQGEPHLPHHGPVAQARNKPWL